MFEQISTISTISWARKILEFVNQKSKNPSTWSTSLKAGPGLARPGPGPPGPGPGPGLQIHKNILTNTQTHLDKYTTTFGQIYKNS